VPRLSRRLSRALLGLCRGSLVGLAGLAMASAGAPPPPAAAPAPPAASGPRFVDVTESSGVHWTHNTGAFGQRYLPETLGPGVVIFDANGDGKPDLLLINGRNFPGKPGEATTPALFLNQGGMKFKEATREAGLDWSAYCLGGAAADVDDDGDPDLYLSCVGQDHLLRNDGGRFVDISKEAGLSQEYGLGASVAFFDADHDGKVDLYVTRYVSWTPETDIYCSTYGQGKSYCTAALYKGATGRFYRNLGNGRFQERTREAGLWNPEAKALGVVPFDLDNDGWTDLAVACDTAPNLVYHNKRDGTFEEIGLVSGVGLPLNGQARGGMGVDAGDYDHSGRASLVITYFSRDMTGLYQNLGEQFFNDVAASSDLGRKTFLNLGWGALFFDYDLDGWLDVLVANGHLDAQVERAEQQIRHAEPQQLFHNERGKGFAEVTGAAGGDLAHPLVGRAAAFADLDGDGDLDLVVTVNGGPVKIFENAGSGHGHWLRLALEGTKSNRDGLGARVEVTAAGMTQTWQVHTGGGYLSQSQIDPVFGLGPAKVADRVVLRWPSGIVQTLSNVAADQRLKIVEKP